MKVFSHVATKRPWFRSGIVELLSDELRVATSGEAAARRGNSLGSLEFGRRAEESAIGQPTAGGAQPRQAVVAEGDRDGTHIYFRATVMVVRTAGDDSKILPKNTEIEIRLLRA